MQDEIKLMMLGEAEGIHFSIPIVTNNWRKLHHNGVMRKRNYRKALKMDWKHDEFCTNLLYSSLCEDVESRWRRLVWRSMYEANRNISNM